MKPRKLLRYTGAGALLALVRFPLLVLVVVLVLAAYLITEVVDYVEDVIEQLRAG